MYFELPKQSKIWNGYDENHLNPCDFKPLKEHKNKASFKCL